MVRRALAMLADVRQRLGRSADLLFALMVLSSLLEGMTIALLFPVLRAVGVSEAGGSNALADSVDALFDLVGVEPTLASASIFVVGFALVQGGIFLAYNRMSATLENRYIAEWRRDLMAGILHARWGFFVERRGGDLVNTVVGETNRLSGAFFTLSQLLAAMVVTAVYASVAFVASPVVTALLLGAAVLVFAAGRGVTRRGHEVGVELTRRNEDLQALAGEFVSGAKLLKSTATEGAATARFEPVVDRLRTLMSWARFQPNMLRGVFETAGILVVVLVLGLGTGVFDIDAATVLVVMALFVRLYPRLSTVQQNLQQLNVYLPAYLVVRRVLEESTAERESLDFGPLPTAIEAEAAEIRAKDLTVAYGDNAVLRALNITIPAASMVALVGPSGAGKSTLVETFLGLVRLEEGTVLVNEHPLDSLPLGSWRRSVGYVAQDTVLFHASIAENIGWGSEWEGAESEREAIEEAARKAHIHDFIVSLPDGYETVVGDRGVRLSGGQRQRLGLARALVRRPRLIIFDEPTSALDSEAEAAVLDAVEGLKGAVTVVFVAHRLSTVRNADVIHLLEDGRIVEFGSWQELLAVNGRFRAIWELQATATAG